MTEGQSETKTNVPALVKQAKALRKQSEVLHGAEKAAEEAIAALRAPYEARVKAVWDEAILDPSLNAASTALDAARKALWARVPDPSGKRNDLSIDGAAQVAEEMAKAAQAATRVPFTEEEFAAWLKDGAPPFNLRRSYGIQTRDPVAVGPYVLLSAAEEYGDRFYLAVAGDPHGPTFDGQGKQVTLGLSIKGWLRVSPSEHRGDSTTAKGEVDGKPFLAIRHGEWAEGKGFTYSAKVVENAGDWGNSVKKPLAQFKAVLLGNLRLRTRIAKGED